jgi:hypothetical protein
MSARNLSPDRYCHEPYGPGTHVVLLCLPDDLAQAALAPYGRVAARVGSVTFWVCRIGSVADAEAVQAIRYPQYRFIRNGSEQHCHTGVMTDDEILECLDHLED